MHIDIECELWWDRTQLKSVSLLSLLFQKIKQFVFTSIIVSDVICNPETISLKYTSTEITSASLQFLS